MELVPVTKDGAVQGFSVCIAFKVFVLVPKEAQVGQNGVAIVRPPIEGEITTTKDKKDKKDSAGGGGVMLKSLGGSGALLAKDRACSTFRDGCDDSFGGCRGCCSA